MKGTQAHAFITSFTPNEMPHVGKLQPADSSQEPRDFYPVVSDWLKKVSPVLRVLESEVHLGELAAFSAYAVAFPAGFLALVDTYDVMRYCKVMDCVGGLYLKLFSSRFTTLGVVKLYSCESKQHGRKFVCIESFDFW